VPTYEYACKKCGEHLDVQQSFSDPALTTCPACKGPLRKVFGNIAITFKGSGFYKTDSRSSNGKGAKKDGETSSTTAASGDSKSGDSKSGDSKSGDSKPSPESKSSDSTSSDTKSKSRESKSGESAPKTPTAAAS
jgi:putative FmdB family regulatory protein